MKRQKEAMAVQGDTPVDDTPPDPGYAEYENAHHQRNSLRKFTKF
jgi:hypothetical protein